MMSRLVLGCGSVGQRVVDRLRTTSTPPAAMLSTSSPTDLVVVSRDEIVVEALQSDGVRARQGDPADRSVLEAVPDPDLIFVAGDSIPENRRVLETVRAVFPDRIVVAYVGERGSADEPGATSGPVARATGSHEPPETAADRHRIESLATHVVDSVPVLLEWFLSRTTEPAAQRALELRGALSAIDGTLAVVMHDNPDPDAIASAVALVEMAEAAGTEADACYYGEISHQENRAMVNLLDLELRQLSATDSLEVYEAFALIDHSRAGINDQLPADLHIDIVVDHHPPRGPVQGDFVDLRAQIGATSTLLTGYLEHLGVDIGPRIATALLYGIRVDTKAFRREVSSLDFEAAATLWPRVDFDIVRQIEQPTIDGDTLETVARTIKNRTQRGSVVVASAGEISDRDALPQAADQLLAMEGVDTTLVFGFREEMVYLSARARGSEIDVGETIRDAFDQIGSAGGHADMAGAQLTMGILAGSEDEAERESILSVVEEVISDRFFEAVDTQAGTPVGLYSQTSEVLFSQRSGGVAESDVENR